MKRLGITVCGAALFLGCSDDAVQSADATGESGDGDGTGDGDGDGDSSADGTGDVTGDGDGDGDGSPPPATNIQIVEVSIDQGARIQIGRDGGILPGAERIAEVLQGRPGLIRAFWEVAPGWTSRPIAAYLTLHQPDDTTSEIQSFITVNDNECGDQSAMDCAYTSLNRSFNFYVRAEDVRPGTQYSIELKEASPGHQDDASTTNPHFPWEGESVQIGVEDSYRKMRVMLVPFHHNLGPQCDPAPDLNAQHGTDLDGNPRTVAEYFAERLAAMNPADEVEVEAHDVVEFGGSMQGTQLLGTLASMRQAEGAPPEWFYYGVGDPCDGGPDFSGVAQVAGPLKGQATNRVGWGVWYENPSSTAGTFVHEIGHEQGRWHIQCSGGEAGPDPAYPNDTGDTDSWGIDVFSDPLYLSKPSDHDYMTYCGNAWVSLWGWLLVAPYIDEMSSWELEDEGQDPVPVRKLLVGRIGADGTHEWFETEGPFEDGLATPGTGASLELDGQTLEVPALRSATSHSEDYSLVIPLDNELLGATAVRWSDSTGTRRVTRSDIGIVHPGKKF